MSDEADASTRAFSKVGGSAPGAEPAGSAARKHPALRIALLVLRIVVAAVAIRFALGKDPGAAFRALGDADPAWLALAGVAIVAVVALSGLRWHSYLHAIGLRVPVATSLQLTFIGGFFNAFLPSGVGGDAYKAMRVASRGSRSEAFASVLLDRFSGLVGLALVAMIAIAVDLEETPKKLLFVSEGVAVAIITATIVPRASREWVLRRAHVADRGPIGHALWRAVRAVADANRSLRIAIPGYAWGVATQAALLAVHVCVARALGIDLPVGILGAAAVVAQVAALIPLTVNGLGFRESAYTWALATAGVARDEGGAAFALGILALLLGVSALGGIVYLVARPTERVAMTPR